MQINKIACIRITLDFSRFENPISLNSGQNFSDGECPVFSDHAVTLSACDAVEGGKVCFDAGRLRGRGSGEGW